jgi:hypothetical protein
MDIASIAKNAKGIEQMHIVLQSVTNTMLETGDHITCESEGCKHE